jgi:methyltransferase-like protein/ubiquinone/menaquinone biosynthesis C-methylase UbiE
MSDISQSFHDEMPYLSRPFPHSLPQNLRAIGLLFGLNPPALATAKVLELGCSSGANIVSFAANYPNSQCVGIDISKVEIDQGLNELSTFTCSNVTLKQANILEVDASWGEFDYIICHGVWSWVPKEVRDKIFEISKQNLSPNGIAHISFNTKPGWNMASTLRDMMLFHTQNTSNPKEKVQQSRAFLEFIDEALEGDISAYTQFLKKETDVLRAKTDSYLYGEYLCENNYSEYFKNFIAHATDRNLSYLADTDLAMMFLGNMPKKVVEQLGQIKNGILSEQYMDFIRNTRFRRTLLCHDDLQIKKNVNAQSLEALLFTLSLIPEKDSKEINFLNNTQVATFYYEGNKDVTITSGKPISKAMFYTLFEHTRYPLSIVDMVDKVASRLGVEKRAEIKQVLESELLKLIFSGHVKIYCEAPKHINEVTDNPTITEYARNQLKYVSETHPWVTNQLHEVVFTDQLMVHLLPILDGSRNKDALLDEMFELPNLNINQGDQVVTDPERRKVLLSQLLDVTLNKLKMSALLVA